jgi:hypothetical protein
MTNTLKERSKNLTSISLESFISDVTAEGENHSFSELLSHPNVHLAHEDPYHKAAISTFDQSFRVRHVSGLHPKEVRRAAAE